MVECYCPDSNGPSYVHHKDCPLSQPARPTRDQYGMILADAVKVMAPCSRRQVGAVIVNEFHEIVATGYNGTPRGELNCSDGGCPRGLLSYAETPAYAPYNNCKGYHAERNARDTAHRHGVTDLTRCTMYVTHDPCADCTVLVEEEGIRVISPNKR